MAKLFTNETRRPVGWPESVQLPVSSSTVFSRPTSTTSPPTPLISTQSPTRMPLRPIRMNQPKKATMKSFIATVSPGAGQAEHGGCLGGHSENDEEDHDRAYSLRRELDDIPQSIDPLVFGGHAGEEPLNNAVGDIHDDHNEKNPERALDHAVQGSALTDLDQADPVGIDVRQVLLILHPPAEVRQILLIARSIA